MSENTPTNEELTEAERPRSTVYLVETNQATRDALAELLSGRGFRVQGLRTAEEFLAVGAASRPACLVLDYNLPGIGGRELQDRLADHARSLPVIVTIGVADVPAAVRFMERCTVTLLEKPFQPEQLLKAVEEAVDMDTIHSRVRRRFEEIGAAVDQLSSREKTVLQAIVAGQLNKAIARALDVSVRTIEGDRAKIVEKFNAETTGEVVGKYAQFNLLTELGYELGKSPKICG
jgi:FixJ family two-component response regulator